MVDSAPSYGYSLVAFPPGGNPKWKGLDSPMLQRVSLGHTVEVFGGAKSRQDATYGLELNEECSYNAQYLGLDAT